MVERCKAACGGKGESVFRSQRLKALWPTVLQKGDEVQCEIEELGVIINKVV